MGVTLTKIYRKIDSDLQALTFTRRSVPVRAGNRYTTPCMDVPGSTRIYYTMYIYFYIHNYIQNSLTPPSNQLLKVCGSNSDFRTRYIRMSINNYLKFGQIVKDPKETKKFSLLSYHNKIL